jgi:hypothetical protein
MNLQYMNIYLKNVMQLHIYSLVFITLVNKGGFIYDFNNQRAIACT